jgi:hypothetical protein
LRGSEVKVTPLETPVEKGYRRGRESRFIDKTVMRGKMYRDRTRRMTLLVSIIEARTRALLRAIGSTGG